MFYQLIFWNFYYFKMEYFTFQVLLIFLAISTNFIIRIPTIYNHVHIGIHMYIRFTITFCIICLFVSYPCCYFSFSKILKRRN